MDEIEKTRYTLYIRWLIKSKHLFKEGGIEFTLFHFRLRPTVLWAQRSDTILLTVSLSDIKNEKVSLENGEFSFKAKAGPEGKLYSVDMTFHKEIIPQVSFEVATPSSIHCVFCRNQSTRKLIEGCSLSSRRKRMDRIGPDYSVGTKR